MGRHATAAPLTNKAFFRREEAPVPRMQYQQGLPLTPALSHWERENCCQRAGEGVALLVQRIRIQNRLPLNLLPEPSPRLRISLANEAGGTCLLIAGCPLSPQCFPLSLGERAGVRGSREELPLNPT